MSLTADSLFHNNTMLSVNVVAAAAVWCCCLLFLCCPLLMTSALYFHPVYDRAIGTNATQVIVIPSFTMNSPTFRQGNVSFEVTAELIPWYQSKSHSEFASCELTNSPQEHQRVAGKLLFLTLPNPVCLMESFILQCQHFLCAGIVVGRREDPAGLATWSLFEGGVDQSSLRAPLVDIRLGFVYVTAFSVLCMMVNLFEMLLKPIRCCKAGRCH